jgi:hypothetical protein
MDDKKTNIFPLSNPLSSEDSLALLIQRFAKIKLEIQSEQNSEINSIIYSKVKLDLEKMIPEAKKMVANLMSKENILSTELMSTELMSTKLIKKRIEFLKELLKKLETFSDMDEKESSKDKDYYEQIIKVYGQLLQVYKKSLLREKIREEQEELKKEIVQKQKESDEILNKMDENLLKDALDKSYFEKVLAGVAKEGKNNGILIDFMKLYNDNFDLFNINTREKINFFRTFDYLPFEILKELDLNKMKEVVFFDFLFKKNENNVLLLKLGNEEKAAVVDVEKAFVYMLGKFWQKNTYDKHPIFIKMLAQMLQSDPQKRLSLQEVKGILEQIRLRNLKVTEDFEKEGSSEENNVCYTTNLDGSFMSPQEEISTLVKKEEKPNYTYYLQQRKKTSFLSAIYGQDFRDRCQRKDELIKRSLDLLHNESQPVREQQHAMIDLIRTSFTNYNCKGEFSGETLGGQCFLEQIANYPEHQKLFQDVIRNFFYETAEEKGLEQPLEKQTVKEEILDSIKKEINESDFPKNCTQSNIIKILNAVDLKPLEELTKAGLLKNQSDSSRFK